jgi:ribose transport system ATP-binding protein
MLDLRGVTKAFGKFRALDAVDFHVAPGEVVALVGANGAGKSTLTKVLAGLYPDADYSGELDGRPLRLSSPNAALEAGIAVVYQEIDLVPEFTVAENMFLGREPTGGALGLRWVRRNELRRRAGEILSVAGLSMLDPDAEVAELAIEMRQMVQVAKALACNSRVVVFDEPTARLSIEGRARLFAVIERLRREGRMVVFVSHHLEEVFAIADRVVVLRDGRLVGDRATSELDVPSLIAMMVGSVRAAPVERSVEFGKTLMTVGNLSSEPFFRDIDFSVRAFEVLGVAGLIGSGRQELIRALIGRQDATGSIEIDGEEILGSTTAAIVGRRIGFVPEDRKRDGIVPLLSIRDNMALPWLRELSRFLLVDKTKVRSRAAELIGNLKVICSSASQEIAELSGGNQQKVVLGRWFGCATPIVVLEAPTVGVDVAGKEEIRRLVHSLAQRGAAVIVSTDDLWELEQLTDRILVIGRGNLKAEFRSRSMRHADLFAAVTGLEATGAEPIQTSPLAGTG